MLIGYARVSSKDQKLDGQIAALQAAGCEKIFREAVSGVKRDRVELARMLRAIGEGDMLVVTRLDRLARSTLDLLNTLDTLRQRGASFRSLAETWADTTTAPGRLMLTVIGGLAEFERELIRERTSEGSARAKARGVHMGRPSKLTPHQKKEAQARIAAGELKAEVALSFNVSPSTISRMTKAGLIATG